MVTLHAVKNESRLLLAGAGKQEMSYYVMLCYVSDIVFVAYGYVAMINSLQSLRRALGSAVMLLFFFVRNFGE